MEEEEEEEEAPLGIKGSSAFMSSSMKGSAEEKTGSLLLLYISIAAAICLPNPAKEKNFAEKQRDPGGWGRRRTAEEESQDGIFFNKREYRGEEIYRPLPGSKSKPKNRRMGLQRSTLPWRDSEKQTLQELVKQKKEKN